MRNRKIKRAISLMISVVLLFSSVVSVQAAGTIQEDLKENDKVVTDNNSEIVTYLRNKGIIVSDEIKTSVDLSKSGYFPRIENQMGGTCGAFSTVYYQYTYEANRLLGVETTDENKYSPYYVYSYVNGETEGISINDAYGFLQEKGCIKWNEFYNSDEWGYDDTKNKTLCLEGYSDNVSAMRNALNVKIEHFYKYHEEYLEQESYTDYNQYRNDKLYMLKLLLSNDVVVVASYSAGLVKDIEQDGANIIYRIGKGWNGPHAVTIVGYDDNFTVDINNNGIIEDTEKGAVKFANSWGRFASDEGYFYVMYDAIVNDTPNLLTSEESIIVPDVKLVWEDDGYYFYNEGVRVNASQYGTIDAFLGSLSCLPKNEDGEYDCWDFRWKLTNIFGCGDEGEKYLDADQTKTFESWRSDITEAWNIKIDKFIDDKKIAGKNCLPKNWDEVMSCYLGTRSRMFSDYGWDDSLNEPYYHNKYSFIKVQQQEVQLVGQVGYQLDNRSGYQLMFSRTDCTDTIEPISRNSVTASIITEEVFDLTELISSRDDLLGQRTWKAELELLDGNKSNYFDFRLTDNLGNVIASKQAIGIDESLGKGEISLTTNFKMCDVTYDGELKTEDLQFIWDVLNGRDDASILQTILVDYNENDVIDRADFSEILNVVSQALKNGDSSFVKITNEELEEFAEEIEYGDNNYDGYMTTADFENVRYYIAGDSTFDLLQKELFDYNGDGTVNMADVYEMLDYASKNILKGDNSFVKITLDELYQILWDFGYTRLGDVTMDGIVNGLDISMLRTMLSGTTYNSIQQILGDVNKDGELNSDDVRQLCAEILYVDVNQNNLYSEADLDAVLYHIAGIEILPSHQWKLVDFDGDGTVVQEEYYMLLYGYYLNTDNNPNLSKDEFYTEYLSGKGRNVGDFNGDNCIDEYDLTVFQNAVAGCPSSYIQLILADINKDLKLDATDIALFETNYMSDIPFTYTVDETAKTITLTRAKDSSVTCIKVKDTYTISKEKYTVTALGENAFSECVDLEEIYLPDTVTQIPCTTYKQSPFYGIENYALKIYYEGATEPEGFGRNWNNYHAVALSYTMKNIEDYFYYTADEESRTLTITGMKGDWCGTDLIIDDRYLVNGEEYRVTAIGDGAFECEFGVESLELPAGVTVIGEWAFADMADLKVVYLERCIHLTEIHRAAFAYCHLLEDAWIPASVETIYADTIEDSIFYDCSSRLDIYVDAPAAKEGWGPYWNYLDEVTVADTTYIRAT